MTHWVRTLWARTCNPEGPWEDMGALGQGSSFPQSSSLIEMRTPWCRTTAPPPRPPAPGQCPCLLLGEFPHLSLIYSERIKGSLSEPVTHNKGFKTASESAFALFMVHVLIRKSCVLSLCGLRLCSGSTLSLLPVIMR